MSESREEVDEAADAALIDRLYGGAEDEDVEGLAAVRSLIARVREEAPVIDAPQAISARLLLAAAEHAPRKAAVEAPAAGGSLWARIKGWFTPMIAHPGLAAALTLVLVAGVGGALYVRGKGGSAEPTIDRTQAPRSPAEHASAPSAGDTPTATGSTAPGVGGSPGSGSAGALVLEGQSEPKEEASGAVRDRAPTTSADPVNGFYDDKGGKDAPPSKKQVKREPVAEKSDKNVEKVGTSGGAGAGANVGGETDETVAPPPPPPTTEDVAKKKVSPDDGVPPVTVVTKQPVQERRPAEDPAPAPDKPNQRVDTSDNAKARELTARAIELARSGKCTDMEKLAAQVKELDRTYYDDAFARQADVIKCRTAKRTPRKK